jgi:CubicO group peptidase (beta-lactamase class C family)
MALVTIAERVASLRAAQPVSTPGTAFHYFNPNYDVLARVVEVATGQTFSDYLQTRIFAPLQMAHTASVVTSAEALAKAHDLAQGHLVAFGVPIPCREMSGYLGAAVG